MVVGVLIVIVGVVLSVGVAVIDALWVDWLTFIFGSYLVSRWLTKTSVVEIICGVELFSLSESKLLGLTIDSHRTIEVHRASVV